MASTISSKQLVYFFKDQINKARTNPNSLVPHLQNRHFINPQQFVHSQIPNVHYKSLQGQPAVQQAINYLSSKLPTHELILSAELSQAAFRVGEQVLRSNVSGNQINPQTYMNKIDFQLLQLGAQDIGQTQMIIEYGFRFDQEIIPMIVVNDGDRSRYNRNLLMSDTVRYLGISVHEHAQYDYMLVILLNGSFRSKEAHCSCSIF